MKYNPLNLLNRDKPQPATEQQSFMVMPSGELTMPKNEFRSHIEKRMQRAISAGSASDGGILATAVALSVPAMVCINYHSNATSTIPIVANDPQGETSDFVPMKHMVENRMRWLIRDIDRSLLIWGYALVRKRYNPAGFPTMLEFLHPLNVRIDTDAKQHVTGYYLQREQEELLLNEVIYISTFDLGDTGNPTSKLENAFAYIGLERGIVTHAASFFFNGASIAGIVTIEGTGLSDEEFETFKKKFARRFTGADNAFKVAILERNVTYTPLSAAPADLAMTELSDQAKQFVCAAFGVNPALVGLGDVSDPLSASATYDATARNFIDMEATPSLDFILDNLNAQWALTDFALPIMLVSDSSAMAMMNDGISTDDMGVATSAVTGNVWTVEEAREHVGYEPFGADDIYISRDPAWVNGLYDNGTISLNMKRAMLGIEPPLAEDMIKIDGVTYKITDRVLVAENNLKKSEAPPSSPFGALSFTPAPSVLSQGVMRPPLELVEAHSELPGNTIDRVFSDDNVVMVKGIARQLSPRLVIGIDLANHQLINLARRELGRALADTPGVTWVSPDSWRVDIAHIDRWSPSDIANMTRVIKWDFNRAEVWTGDYFVSGNSIYLSLGDTEATTDMAKLVQADLRSVSIKSDEATPAMAIRLCGCDSIDASMLPTDSALGSMPVVFTRIAAFANDKIQHKWRLRAYLDKDNQELLSKQRDELSKWSMKAARSGLSAEWNIECLPAHVVRFVRGDDIISEGEQYDRIG